MVTQISRSRHQTTKAHHQIHNNLNMRPLQQLYRESNSITYVKVSHLTIIKTVNMVKYLITELKKQLYNLMDLHYCITMKTERNKVSLSQSFTLPSKCYI